MARVLLVDDDPAGLQIRQLLLERAGHQVTSVVNVEQARAQCRHCPPETVILDLRLPQADDGLALIRDLRAAIPAMRMIVLSGCCADLDGRSEQSLVDAVLSKPVASDRLLAALA